MDSMAALAESLKEALPDVEIEHRVEEDEIYVNYDFSEAVVIEHNLDQRGVFVLTAMAWDRTGGVSAEHEIANTVAALVPLMVKRFLAQQEEQERKLDALLASRPEED